ncbi:MAG: hypothetical protein IKN03_05840 [Fibrobacter sp.]|nr:hypothetical protein [Fibrobacter sp.]MBR6854900.1 hypothetical protein [Fibrobacter sp.]
MKGTQKKPNQKKEFMIWLAAIMLVVIGIASSSMMVALAFFFITKSLG